VRLQSTKPYFCAVGWGVSIKLVALPHLLIALGIEVEILLLFAKDCSGKPAMKGNALIIKLYAELLEGALAFEFICWGIAALAKASFK
jgi:hypothetical protein